jgi:acyl carrier protein
MDSADILQAIREIMMKVLDVRHLEIDENTSAQDVKGWDSMTHVRLVMTVERKFKIKFKNSEIGSLNNIGDLVRLIEAKT